MSELVRAAAIRVAAEPPVAAQRERAGRTIPVKRPVRPRAQARVRQGQSGQAPNLAGTALAGRRARRRRRRVGERSLARAGEKDESERESRAQRLEATLEQRHAVFHVHLALVPARADLYVRKLQGQTMTGETEIQARAQAGRAADQA